MPDLPIINLNCTISQLVETSLAFAELVESWTDLKFDWTKDELVNKALDDRPGHHSEIGQGVID